MEKKNIKDLRNEKMIYLRNAVGEDTGNDEIPEDVEKWFAKVYDDKEWLQYLVKYGNKYGIVALWEIDHPTSESWNQESLGSQDPEWSKLAGAQIWFRLKRFCKNIQEILDYDVLLGRKTGIFGQHELAFFIPYGTSKEEYESKFSAIKKIYLFNRSQLLLLKGDNL